MSYVDSDVGVTARVGRTGAWWALLGAAAALTLRWPARTLAFSADEGYYSVVARLWLDGHALYRDLGFVRPPGLAWVYALPRTMGFFAGDGFLRVLSGLAMASTVALLVWWLSRSTSRAGTVIAGLCLLVWSASLAMQNEANAETWLLLPYAASGLLAFESFRRADQDRAAIPLALAAGLAVGVAALFKQVAWVGLAAPFAAWVAMRKPRRGAVVLVSAFMAGAVAAAAAQLALIASVGDGVSAYLYFVWISAPSYVERAQSTSGAFLGQRLVAVAPPLLGPVSITVVAGAIACAARRERASNPVLVFAAWWFGISFVGVAASGRFYPHYFLQLVPASTLLIASCTDAALACSHGRIRRPILVLLAAVALAAASLTADYVGLPRLRSSRQSAVALAARADYRVRPGGTVLVWGPPATAAYVKSELWGSVPWLYHGIGAPGATEVLGRRVESQGDRFLRLLAARPAPDAVALQTVVWPPEPGAAPDDTRVSDALSELLADDYEPVWRSKRGRRHGELYLPR